jgi:phosphatidylinositol kinase/protein kinase (PI-3  family)
MNIHSLYNVYTGDDVRQDELALQLITYMDRILKGKGLNLELITYEVRL